MQFDSPHKKITKSYIIALSIIVILLIISQALIHNSLQEQAYDSKTINLSGRQRMLSQKISKLALIIERQTDKKNFNKKYLDSLQKSLKLFTATHNALIKSDTLMQVSEQNQEYYKQLENPRQNMVKGAQSILLHYEDKDKVQKATQSILLYESTFLKYMNKITFQYDKEAKQNTKTLDLIELILLLSTLFTLFLEVILIFRPATKYLKRYFYLISEKNKELQDLYQEVRASLETISIQNKEISSFHHEVSLSIDYAQRIQQATLTPVEEIKTYLPNSFIFWKPRDIVSGDFYFFTKRGNKTIIAMIDCTGHGVPGAFMSLIAHELLNNIINIRNITNPCDILMKLRVEIRKRLRQETNGNTDGLEIAICAMHEDSKNAYIEYSGSYRPLVYFQNGELKVIKGDKIIIGGFSDMFKKKSFTQFKVPLNTATTFYIFSDGLQDQFGGEINRKLGSRRLYELLKDIHEKPISEQEELLRKEVEQWQGTYRQTDDMLLIGVEIT